MTGFRVWATLLTAGVPMSIASSATAQNNQANDATIAKVTAIQRVVEKKARGEGEFTKAPAGTTLSIGDSLRTGRRSKADLNFTDGSLLRLSQLATVEVQSTKGVQLSSGRVLFSMLKPGRVLAGKAAAEIKGSVGLITILEHGDAEFSLYSGRMDVVTPNATVNVPPGKYVTIFADGSSSPVRNAPPLRFALGATLPSLLEPPSDAPFVGSKADERSRRTPERLALATSYYETRNINTTPYPDTQIGTGDTGRSGGESALLALLAAGSGALLASNDASGADRAHIDEASPRLGQALDGDATLVALGATRSPGSDGTVVAGRLRGFYTKGPVFAEAALAPIHSRFGTETSTYLSVVSDASVTLRTRRGDFQLGRQRFLSGPTRATVIGALARQGGRQVMDAITFRPALGHGFSAQASYLTDAYIKYLPYEVDGGQRGFFGRVGVERRYGNFGLNVLRYANLPVATRTGVSLDFALPVIRNQLELYGEVGRDPFRRGLATVGAAFPGLYEKTGIEAYLEYARLQHRDDALQPPNELTLLIYKRLNRKMSLTSSLSHLSNSTNLATLGVTLGTRSYFSDGD